MFSTVVPAKGVVQEESVAVDYMLECIRSLGYANSTIHLKSDQEPAIEAVNAKIIATRTAPTVPVNSPKGSSQSNGSVENAVQQVEGNVRTLRLALSENLQARISMTHPLTSWLVLHAGLCYNRFQVGHDGKTAYFRNFGKQFDKQLVQIRGIRKFQTQPH